MTSACLPAPGAAPAKVRSIRFFTGSLRRKPAIGDRRVTKAHGLQIRVVRTHDGMCVCSGSRYLYDWCSPGDLVGTRWEYLLRRLLPQAS